MTLFGHTTPVRTLRVALTPPDFSRFEILQDACAGSDSAERSLNFRRQP